MAEQVVKLKLDTSSFDRALKAATAALAGLVSVQTLRSIVNITSNFEDLQDTLTSVTGSANKGAQAFKNIQNFATRTQFGVEELTNTYIKLQGAGITPTEKLLTTFTDAAAVTTDQLGTLTSITDLFSRTVSGGLGIQELDRLNDRGLPVYTMLIEKLGIARNQVTEYGKSAEGAAKITKALEEAINEAFGGATASKLDNLSTLQSNFSIQLRNTANIIGTEMAPALKEVIEDFTKFLASNDALAAQLGRGLGESIRSIAGFLKLLAQNIELVQTALYTFISFKLLTSLAILLRTAAGESKKGITAFRALGNAIKTLAGIAITFVKANPIGLLVTAIASLTLGLVGSNGLGRSIAQVNAAFEYFGINLTAVKDFFVTTFFKVLDFFREKLAQLRRGFVNMINSIAKFIPGFSGIKDVSEDVGKAITDAFKGGVDKVSSFIDHVKRAGEEYDRLKNITSEDITQGSTIAGAMPTITPPGLDAFGGPGRAISTPTQKELDAQKAALDAKFETLQASLRTETEAEIFAYENRLQILRDYYHDKTGLDDQQKKITERLETSHQKRMAEIAKNNFDKQLNTFKSGKFAELNFTEMSEKEKVKFAIEGGKEVLSALGQQSREAFQLMKAAAIAEAIINTAQGVTKALAQGGIFGPLLAGVIVAAGAAQIATIASQNYTGRQFGGPVTKGRQYLVGENGPEMFVPSGSGQIVPNRGLDDNKVVNINFNIQAVDAVGLDQVILQRKGLITNIVREGMENQGRRSVV